MLITTEKKNNLHCPPFFSFLSLQQTNTERAGLGGFFSSAQHKTFNCCHNLPKRSRPEPQMGPKWGFSDILGGTQGGTATLPSTAAVCITIRETHKSQKFALA